MPYFTHPTGRVLTLNWSVNGFIMVANENFYIKFS